MATVAMVDGEGRCGRVPDEGRPAGRAERRWRWEGRGGGGTRREVLGALAPLAAVALAACGGQQGQSSAEVSRRPATIEFWTPAQDPPQLATQEHVNREFESKYPHLTIKMDQLATWDALTEKLAVTIAGGTQPNTTLLPDNNLRLLIYQGQLTALDDFARRDKYDVKVLDKGMRDRGTVDGKLFILPWAAAILALYYNQDLFERAGVPLPDAVKAMSWEQFVDAAVKVRRLGDEVWGFRVAGDLTTPNWSAVKEWLPWCWSNGNDYFDATETRALFGDDKGIASVQLFTDLMRKYLATPGPGTEIPKITSGRLGMWVSQSGDIATIRRDAPNMRFGASIIPIGPGGKASCGVQGGKFIAIARGAKNPDQTWQYLRWSTDEAINLRLVTPAFQDPVHASNRLKPPYADAAPYKAFVEQFKTARARPGNPAYRLTEENTAEQLQAAYKGLVSPADAAKAAVDRASSVIQQNAHLNRLM
jgi:ABC-type glycerol-3-phosphate transport system substrate-binding protein